MQRKRQKTTRASRLFIDEKIFNRSAMRSAAVVARDVLLQLRTFDFANRPDLIHQMGAHPKLPAGFYPIYRSDKDFHVSVNVASWVSPEKYVSWLHGLFVAKEEELRSFNELRNSVGAQILKGDALAALTVLEEVEQISQSWWGLSLGFHIRKELLGEETKFAIRGLTDRYPHLNISPVVSDLLLLSESNAIGLYVSTVTGRLREYKSSGIHSVIQHGAVESCRLLPISYDPTRNPTAEHLFGHRSWSLLDQYMSFRSIMAEQWILQRLSTEQKDMAALLAERTGDFGLLNLLSPSKDSHPIVAKIIDAYTYGDYHGALSLIRAELGRDANLVGGLIEIYARSKVYTGTAGTGNTFFDKIANEFAKVLTVDPRSGEAVSYIHKVALKFRDLPWAKSLLYQILALYPWGRDGRSVELARLATQELGALNTPRARDPSSLPHAIEIGDPLVPVNRSIRYRDGSPGDTINGSDFPIYSDYLVTRSRWLMAQRNYIGALDFCVDEYLKNPVSLDHLPISELCEIVAIDEDREGLDHISCMVLFDIYSRERGQRFDDVKGLIFEEFLSSSITYRPSQIFKVDQINSKVLIFLKNVCVPAQLDNIVEFSSYDEVIYERVAIIDLILSAHQDMADELSVEKDNVLETLFSEKLRAKMESGKLYVDVQALESKRRHVYAALYDEAKSLEGGASLAPLQRIGENVESNDIFQIAAAPPVAVASSKKSSILLKIFMQAVRDFALNEDYGLDKYLSAEVRHTVFVTQLRACFEKTRLVTIQKDGGYQPNAHWLATYTYLPYIAPTIDGLLQKFSADVDEILAAVNDRFRINVTEHSVEHVFDYGPYHDRIVLVSDIVEKASSFEEFFSKLIDLMWDLAHEGALRAQLVLNDVLLADVRTVIDRLEQDVSEIKGNVALHDFMQAIRDVRTEFSKEVEVIVNWFRFAGRDDDRTLEPLGVVSDAAVSTFSSMFKNRGRELVFNPAKSRVLLTYKEARALFISLFTALENSLRYGDSAHPVVIDLREGERRDEIVVTNELSYVIDDPEKFLAEKKGMWNEKYSSLSTAEGGTGLYKIYSLLAGASPGFDFNIFLAGGTFRAVIGLRHENFGYRR